MRAIVMHCLGLGKELGTTRAEMTMEEIDPHHEVSFGEENQEQYQAYNPTLQG